MSPDPVPRDIREALWPCHWCGAAALDYPSLALHQKQECRVLRRFRAFRARQDVERVAQRKPPVPVVVPLWFEA